jgi:hypothetical protein
LDHSKEKSLEGWARLKAAREAAAGADAYAKAGVAQTLQEHQGGLRGQQLTAQSADARFGHETSMQQRREDFSHSMRLKYAELEKRKAEHRHAMQIRDLQHAPTPEPQHSSDSALDFSLRKIAALEDSLKEHQEALTRVAAVTERSITGRKRVVRNEHGRIIGLEIEDN